MLLCHTQEQINDHGFKVWNKNDFKDRQHVLPVITPVYPAMNSMSFASVSTRQAIFDEVCLSVCCCFDDVDG